jgi:transposase
MPAIATARTLAITFIRLLRQRRAAEIPGWLLQAGPSGVPELREFARGLRQDGEAVLAAFRLPWSPGQRRSGQPAESPQALGYSRASLDLLRIRVLSRL